MNEADLSTTIRDYLNQSPLSLVIRETCRIYAVERILKNYNESHKILDVGCGDGNWWRLLSKKTKFQVDGIDINATEVSKATNIRARVIDVTDKSQTSILEKDYNLVIGNCSLEHIPNIDLALQNIHSCLADSATFVLFVPTPCWALKGRSVQFLNSISPRLSMMFSGMINGFFQHWHLYHHRLWSHILTRNQFVIEDIKGLGSARLEFIFRLHLPTAFISFLVKSMTGKYLNSYVKNLVPASYFDAITKDLSKEIIRSITGPDDENAFEYMIIARKA